MKLRDIETLPDEALINGRQVDRLMGDQSRWTRNRRIEAGILPRPFKLPGSNVDYWQVGTIRRLLASFAQAA